MGQRFEQILYQIRHTDGKWAYETVLNIVIYYRNEKWNHNGMPVHTSPMA